MASASDRSGAAAPATISHAPDGGGELAHGVASIGAGGAAAAIVAVAEIPVEAGPPAEGGEAAAPGLDRIQALWSGVADAVREENGMVAALIADAMPSALEGRRLTVVFPADAAFSKRKAEANRELVLGALRSLTGAALTVVFELGQEGADGGGPVVVARTLGEEELLARLRSDFAAQEVFAEAEPEAAATEPTDPSPDTEDR